MSRWRRPLEAREVKQIAKNLGFIHRNTEGGHENWVREDPKPFRKMTIDSHIAPFSDKLIGYMAAQAGVSVKEFYDALTTPNIPAKDPKPDSPLVMAVKTVLNSFGKKARRR